MEATATRTVEASAVKPGDVLTWDFRGDRLGDVEVFDAYPIGRDTVQVVLLAGDGCRYRKVAASTPFVLR